MTRCLALLFLAFGLSASEASTSTTSASSLAPNGLVNGDQGVFMAISGGGGAAVGLGNRSGGGKRRSLGRYGGSRQTESRVNDALTAFAHSQQPDGSFPHKSGKAADTILQTSLAATAFITSGYDHRMPSKFRKNVESALDYLGSQPKDDNGLFADNIAIQASVTLVVAESFRMTNDPELRATTEGLVTSLVNAQISKGDDIGGWATSYGGTKADLSSTAKATIALRSARIAGFEVTEALERATTWCHKALEQALANDPLAADVGYLLAASTLTGFDTTHPSLEPIRQAMTTDPTAARSTWNAEQDRYWTLGIFQLGDHAWISFNDVSRSVKSDQVRALLATKQQGDPASPDLAHVTLGLSVYYAYPLVRNEK